MESWIGKVAELVKKNPEYINIYGELLLYNFVEELKYIECKACLNSSVNVISEIKLLESLYKLDDRMKQLFHDNGIDDLIASRMAYFSSGGTPIMRKANPHLAMDKFYDGTDCEGFLKKIPNGL